jgi:pimeloyl-ACP methyl ester carboxylesterase
MIERLTATARDGITVVARHAGDRGRPAVFFVHGVGSTAAIWDYQLRTLSDAFDCYAIELRGSGVTEVDDSAFISREGFVDDVLAIADARGIERFHFVGCSLGGVVGFELWKRVPQRLVSLTFVGSFAAYPNAQTYADNVKTAARVAGTMEAFARDRAAKLGMPPGVRTDETISQMACKSIDNYVASTQATWTGDYRSMLSSVAVPTLVIVGERDTIAPSILASEIARGIPDARMETIPGAGHVTNADAPAAFDVLLRGFLASARSGVR